MSAGAQSVAKLPQSPDVLGDLLHSLSQPLTSLRCSLELSIDEGAEKQQKSIAVALQQTERVIGMVQLMREYLDAEQPGGGGEYSAPVAAAARAVIEGLSSIAALRGVRLRLVGTCAATLPVPESRLRLALQYLIAILMEGQPVGGKITLLLGEGPAGAVLRAEGEPVRRLDFDNPAYPHAAGSSSQAKSDPARPGSISTLTLTLRRVRLAIASRVIEGAGASLVLGDGSISADPAWFVLRIPRRMGALG